jgi:3-deoxy-D-manno-octulosonic acid kinase
MHAEIPTGFAERRKAGAHLVYDPGLEADLENLGLLDPNQFEERLRDASVGAGDTGSGSAGRAPTVLLPLRDGTRLLVRPFWRGGAIAPLLGPRLFGPARPLRELCVTQQLHQRGAPVPRPAFAWTRRSGILYRAALATFFEEGALDALAFLERGPGAKRVRRAARALGHAVRAFHDAEGSHPDLHLKNLLLYESPRADEALVVDLDRVDLEPHLGASARMAQLMRLYRSLVKRRVLDRVGARGVATFFSAYVQGDRALRRALRSRLPCERRRLALHAWRY